MAFLLANTLSPSVYFIVYNRHGIALYYIYFFFVKKRTYSKGCPNKGGKGRRRKGREQKVSGPKGPNFARKITSTHKKKIYRTM